MMRPSPFRTLVGLGLLFAVANCSPPQIPSPETGPADTSRREATVGPDSTDPPDGDPPVEDAGMDAMMMDQTPVDVPVPPPDRVNPPDGPPSDNQVIPPDAPAPMMGETCAGPFDPCTASAGTTRFVRIRGTVVSPDTLQCNSEVLFSSETGRIVCVGNECATRPEAMGAQVICANGVIYPGIIDPHQHADYNHMPVFRHTRLYDNRNTWRNYEPLYDTFKIPHRPFGSTMRDNQVLVQRWAEVRLNMAGGTAMIGTAGALLSNPGIRGWVRNLDSNQIDASQLPMNFYVDPDIDSVVVRADGTVNMNETMMHLSGIVARFSQGNYRAFIPHLSEGIDAPARAEFDVANMLGAVTNKTAIVHGTAFSASQFARMAEVRADLIWSPQSNADLYGITANVTVARALGIRIAIGVDWTPSGTMHPLEEVACAAQLNRTYLDNTFTDRELVQMLTINGAHAANMEDLLGSLEPNKLADIVVLRGDRMRPYRALLEARAENVRLVVVNGVATYGDPDAATGAVVGTQMCMPVPDGLSPPGMTGVCGAAKNICAQPADLASLRTMITGILNTARNADTMCSGASPSGNYCYAYDLFPLFRCGAPDLSRCRLGHPAVPRRAPGGGMIPAVSGMPVAGTDDDGDGVPNMRDNCPRIFNPPFDIATTQEDTNGDGRGDVCDPTPCRRMDGTNACQGGGPVDPCVANPMLPMCMPPAGMRTIPQVRDPMSTMRPASGTTVTVTGGVVTAIKSAGTTHGFFIQDPSAMRYAGLYVFVGTAAVTVNLMDRVNVTGRFTTFRGLEQIDTQSGGMIMSAGTAATSLPAPVVVMPTDINATGARAAELQSMLVSVENVVALTASAATGSREFTVGANAMTPTAQALTVTSFVASDTGTSPFPTMMGDQFTRITGVAYMFDSSRLAPRNAMDLVRR